MRFKDEFGGKPARLEGCKENEALDPMLEQTLAEFRSSVFAWSEAAYQRPRAALAAAPRRQVWRLAAGWALGIALIAGGVSGGLNVRHHRQELARIAAAHEAEAKVDSDVSREVPSAMEPLAQLMAEDETR
jgi:hypothetical protein